MFKDIPNPVRSTFWKHTLLAGAIVVAGCIWGFVADDPDMLLLTAVLAALGAWRCVHLYKVMRDGKYYILEGNVVSDIKHTMNNSRNLTLKLPDGEQVVIPLSGKHALYPGHSYRLYLYCSLPTDIMESLPEILRPAFTLLGCEELD